MRRLQRARPVAQKAKTPEEHAEAVESQAGGAEDRQPVVTPAAEPVAKAEGEAMEGQGEVEKVDGEQAIEGDGKAKVEAEGNAKDVAMESSEKVGAIGEGG